MPGIERCGDRRAEIDVAQAQHEIARVEDDPLHLLDALQPVDAPDEFDIARAPRSVGPHGLCVFLYRHAGRWIVPGKRQMHDAGRHLDRIDIGQLAFPHEATFP